ncbi:MAG: hypothetical protein ACM35E_12600, partial [Deltaproteobacteria bacterium]
DVNQLVKDASIDLVVYDPVCIRQIEQENLSVIGRAATCSTSSLLIAVPSPDHRTLAETHRLIKTDPAKYLPMISDHRPVPGE